MRQHWIDPADTLAITRQCELAGVSRSTWYARSESESSRINGTDEVLLRLIDAEYTAHPFYGSRRMRVILARQGHVVNRKRVQRLMRILGLAGMAPGPATSKPHPDHRVYPYLLRGVPVVRPNQVWSTDITYIGLPKGPVYLMAVMDWYSRKVLSFRLSNTQDVTLCVGGLEQALKRYGVPEIFNTDQGSQFTSLAFTQCLKDHGIQISMDGRGRAADNIFVERLWRTIKYEDIYLKDYTTMDALHRGLTDFFAFYNEERPHQSLDYQTPSVVHATAVGGGALIVDRYGNPASQAELTSPCTGVNPVHTTLT